MSWRRLFVVVLAMATALPSLAFDPVDCESAARRLKKAARELEDAASSFEATRRDDRGEAMRGMSQQATEVARLTERVMKSCSGPAPVRVKP